MDMTTPMQPKPLVDATCKLGEKGCFKDGRCHALGDCENKIVTNADHIRAMSDEELAEFLMDLMFTTPCFGEGIFPYHPCPQDQDCKKCGMDWLKRPYKEDV